ncbi:MAG TPA: hypothetical protein VN721_07110 [Flavipsychrobacter sp.]|nr:hypothetical protein [Flavipsychrobacter sp.]
MKGFFKGLEHLFNYISKVKTLFMPEEVEVTFKVVNGIRTYSYKKVAK